MALSAGHRLGPYEIEAALGSGGMGEVFRARDTKLHRRVAIKILPEGFAHDAERVARFRREAQVLAGLNHPRIGAIYGLEEANGQQFLVLELIEGETLASCIAKGPLPIDDGIAIARQIAEALEAAHEKGVVHRDLKPSNIALTADDQVKVLDFGLAKATGASPSHEYDAEHSPTLTSPVTLTGASVILGTAAYMSPEQAKGRAADKRSDVWAFGCVLYEMLTGKRAFHGDGVSDTLAMVLKGEPDWHALPSGLPPAVRALIEGCLRKDRNERIGDLSTARFLLSQSPGMSPSSLVAPSPIHRRALLVLAGVLIGAAVLAAAMLWRRTPPPAASVTRFTITPPPGYLLNPQRPAVDISPDGARVVYTGGRGLALRSLSDLELTEIPGTDFALNPVFSPDGQSLAFWANSELKRIALDGGPAVTICQVGSAPSSIVWSDDDILFTPQGTAIMRVPSNGGKPEVLLDLHNSEDVAHGPQLLAGGRTVLFTILKRTPAVSAPRGHIVVQSLQTGVRKTLIDGGTDARYVPTGHVVYVSEGTLFAVPFDLPKLELTGRAVPVVPGFRWGSVFGASWWGAQFAFSSTGSLVYLPGSPSAGQQDLMLFDRKGGAQTLGLPPGRVDYPRVSPDGRQIAFGTTYGNEAAVSIYELSGASSVRRLTFGGNNRFPIWSADGRHVAFQSDREGDLAVFWQPVDGGAAERLTRPDPGTSHRPESWSPNGEVLLFNTTKDFVLSLWALSLRDRTTTPFGDVKGSSVPTNAVFSPDGRWVAYQMAEDAVSETTLYVQPFPPTGTKYQIERGGRPLWSRDGKELFFVPGPGRFMVVAVRTEPSFAFTSPVSMPRGFGLASAVTPRTFDIMPDGRILGVGTSGQSQSGSGPEQIQVVLNWFEELKARVPTK